MCFLVFSDLKALMHYRHQRFKVGFLRHVWTDGGFLPVLVGKEMYKCDTMIAFNPQRRVEGELQHGGKERPQHTKKEINNARFCKVTV